VYFVASYFAFPVGRSGNGHMLSVLWPSIFSSFQTSFCCRRKKSGHSFEFRITCALYVFRVCGVTSIGQFANGLLENLNTVPSSYDVRDMIIYVGTRTLMLSSLISSPGYFLWFVLLFYCVDFMVMVFRPDDLRIPFERFGPVKDVYLPKDYYSGYALLLNSEGFWHSMLAPVTGIL